MKNRRKFLAEAKNLSLLGVATLSLPGIVAKVMAFEDSDQVEGTEGDTIKMYDTYMMATYMDGSLGPKTGICKVDYVLANEEVSLDFWHGHGGKLHKFTIKPEHYKQLKLNKKVVITTTVVDNHTHKLFIDPTDAKWRVPGAQPVDVPVDTGDGG